MEKEVKDLEGLVGSILPQGNSIVAQSKNFSGIVLRVCQGWTWKVIAKWLLEECNEVIPSEKIKSYYNRFLKQELAEVRQKSRLEDVNEIAEIESMVRLQKERVKNLEEFLKTQGISRHPDLRKEMELLSSLLQTSLNMKKALGLLKEEKTVEEVEMDVPEEELLILEQELLESMKRGKIKQAQPSKMRDE